MRHGKVNRQTARGLLALKERIAESKIPSSKVDETLNIATWNIRELGKKPRTQPAIHYIAEILGQFDLIGVVELRADLTDLGRILAILGPSWRVVYSDMIPDHAGNRERIAYVYDSRTVTFNGLAAEANEPRQKKRFDYLPSTTFWRSPYLASFSSGSFDFLALTVHVRWGPDAKSGQKELSQLADWIEAKRLDETSEDKDLLVLGDFNIPTKRGLLFETITKHGLQISAALAGLEHGSNLAKNKRYDQILHYPGYPETFTNRRGVLDFYGDERSMRKLFPGIEKNAFTFQVSDHLPLWMQVRTDVEGFVLEQVVRG